MPGSPAFVSSPKCQGAIAKSIPQCGHRAVARGRGGCRGGWGVPTGFLAVNGHEVVCFGQVLLRGVPGGPGGARDVGQGKGAGALELLHVPAPAQLRGAAAPAGLEHPSAGFLHQ